MGTIIVGAVVFGLFGFAIYKIVKKPKGSCGCGCDGCSQAGHCH